MVKTRHSGEGDIESSPGFLSLSNESQRNKKAEDDSRRRKYTVNEDHAYNIFQEEKVVETRLRPRNGPDRAYNYLDADSSDDDSYRRGRHQQQQEKMLRSDDSPPRRRTREIKQEMIVAHESGRRSSRRRISEQHEEQHSVTDEEEEDGTVDTGRRRSSRTRRQVYDTLNQSYILSYPIKGKGDEQEGQDEDSDGKHGDSDDNNEFSDMYSRVKRKRIRVKRNMYGVPINDSDSDQAEISASARRNRNNNKDDDDEEEEEEEDGEENENNAVNESGPSRRHSVKKRQPMIVKSYSLREHKPRTDLYKAPVEEPRIRRTDHSIFATTPTKKNPRQTYQSPAQRRHYRKRSAFHSSSSSTSSSSSDSESSDEKKFKRRKAKSMAKARSRLMPMNFSTNAMPSSSVIKDRVKSGASLADVEPMKIDKNVTFNSIGGLGKHIRALKEMVVFPLLYDKVFQRFKVDPPRGVLFYGPPGTGKTLVARALANECSQGDRKVAFFMRKGADCLSKWVGESERQLRLLFDQAYKYRPSIIFFDEIDGLAPVRSSRQDQIHSSIVSTLLALMDGLDSRGEIVVIGATNRIDSLDPALRRPGRFDREFLFPLPSMEARKQILKIHTASWTPKLNDNFLTELAEKCVGYCGADLKALCTEAAMFALRRRYPQIYISNEALQLDESSIQVSAKDFFDGVNNIIPTSQRSVSAPARALNNRVCPLLQRQLDLVMEQLGDSFPLSLGQTTTLDAAATTTQAEALAESGAIWDEMASDEEEDAPSIFVSPSAGKGSRNNKSLEAGLSHAANYLKFTSYATSRPVTFRPRLILVGHEGQGQTTHIAPAVIHKMENLPVHVLDLPALYAVTAKTPEESCANVFHEAKRKCPSIVYLPYVNQWWDVMADTLRATLLTLIQDLDPSLPLLLLATSERPYNTLDPVLQSLFSRNAGEVIAMNNPNKEEREEFFQGLLLKQACRPPPKKKQAGEILKLLEQTKRAVRQSRNKRKCVFTKKKHSAERMLEVLPKAQPSKPRELTKTELKQLQEKEELTLMELRIFLRDVLNKLGSDKKFSIFTKPVNIEDAPDYYEVIEHPMDLSTMMGKIDLHEYNTVQEFMHDVDLICSNALEYNPNRGPMDRVIRHRACAMKDTAYAIIKTELDKDFEKMCVEIKESRQRRGEKSTSVPNFYNTLPAMSRPAQPRIPSYLENPKPMRSIPEPDGQRFSRRVRGLNSDPVPPLEAVEKVYKSFRSASSPSKDNVSNSSSERQQVTKNTSNEKQNVCVKDTPNVKPDITCVKDTPSEGIVKAQTPSSSSNPKTNPDSTGSKDSKRKKTSKCVWCRPKRKRPRLTFSRPQTAQEEEEEEGEDLDTSHVEEEEVEKEKVTEETSVSEQLQVNVNEDQVSKEVISPSARSPRLASVSSAPLGVQTRRSSMSPRGERLSSPTVPASTQSKEEDGGKMAITEDEETPVVEEQKPEDTIQAVPVSLTNCVEKPSVVKRLDLDSLTVDSGVASSLESNGDSRDSLDHNTRVQDAKTQPSEPSELKDSNQNSNSVKKQATAILSETPKDFVVDVPRLTSLLHHLVAQTDGCAVERLEKIYSQLSMVIHRHRHNSDRTAMVKELESKSDELTRGGPSTSRDKSSKHH